MTENPARFERSAQSLIRELRSMSSPIATPSDGREDRLHDELCALLLAWDPRSAAVPDALVQALCELALHREARQNELGRRLIFAAIAESLGDSFEPDKAALYDDLFARVIDYCRHQPAGRALDLVLSRFGLTSVEGLLARKAQRTLSRSCPTSERRRIRRVLVPSRVTLGADVAVTSVVLQKIERVFPEAECVVFGPIAVAELLERTVRRVRFLDVPYQRRGGLMARLDAWVALVDAVQTEITPEAGSCLLLDPDSRLTQLGLLPLVHEDVPSFFFESRAYRWPDVETLGELTVRWLDDTLGADDGGRLYPKVLPAKSLAVAARRVAQQARASGAGHVTAVTLGVGGNARKRIAGCFELELVRALLSDGGVVILDKGIGEEVARMEAIIAALAAQGTSVVELQATPPALPPGASGQLLVYQGGLRSLVALVAASDLYVGYDSAFQHVAAALAVPVIDVFVNPPNHLFSQRWRPYSKAPVKVVGATDVDGADTLVRVLAACRELRTTAVDRRWLVADPQ